MKVFVSSTKDDLDPDCRPKLLEAISFAGAMPVAMEDWPAEYLPALELVREKLKGSTHYVGVFAYRRGWTPPGHTVSITEEEFNMACTRLGGRCVAVFVPLEGSEIARLLRDRAGAQAAADEEAQREFLRRVTSEGVVEQFNDVTQLALRANRRVVLWNRPLLEEALAGPARRAAVPRPDEVAGLGRAEQAHCFETRVLPHVAGAGSPNAVGVLVAGPPAYGQDRLVERLRRAFERTVFRPPLQVAVGCAPMWGDGSAANLLQRVARAVGVPEPATMAVVGARIGEVLGVNDVVLEITQVQNFSGGVPGFVERFWRPLLDALPAGTLNRVLCLATHEGALPPAGGWDGAVRRCADAGLDPRALLLLPELGAFTPDDLTVFVRARVEPQNVRPLVKHLMEQTGGVPSYLYSLLATESTWET